MDYKILSFSFKEIVSLERETMVISHIYWLLTWMALAHNTKDEGGKNLYFIYYGNTFSEWIQIAQT